MGKDLIDATPEHDVTAKQHRHHIRITDQPDHRHPQSTADIHASWRTSKSYRSARRRNPVLRRWVNRPFGLAQPEPHFGQTTEFPRHHHHGTQPAANRRAESPHDRAQIHIAADSGRGRAPPGMVKDPPFDRNQLRSYRLKPAGSFHTRSDTRGRTAAPAAIQAHPSAFL